jgi:hypothetical protein
LSTGLIVSAAPCTPVPIGIAWLGADVSAAAEKSAAAAASRLSLRIVFLLLVIGMKSPLAREY